LFSGVGGFPPYSDSDQADFRRFCEAERFAMKALRRAPRCQGIRVYSSFADWIAALIKRLDVMLSSLGRVFF
jgi:hypothetical protein